MFTNSGTKLFGLIGNPVSGSKSPQIHSISFDKNDIEGAYVAFKVDEDYLEKAVQGFVAIEAGGFNVTVPYKEKILPFLDEICGEAQSMMSVNTVKIQDKKLIGYNTDGAGFLKALELSDFSIEGKDILILGAGGASRGIAHAIAKNREKGRLIIANRTILKAKTICDELSNFYPKEGSEYLTLSTDNIEESVKDMNIKLVINTTSVGMEPNIHEMPLDPMIFSGRGKDITFADIVYKPHTTKFLKSAFDAGFSIIHGINMLIYQALLAEEIWLDRSIDIEGTKDEIYKIMKIGD